MLVTGFERVLNVVLRSSRFSLKRGLKQHDLLVKCALKVGLSIVSMRSKLIELNDRAEICPSGVDLFSNSVI